jgi:hypothetical protein
MIIKEARMMGTQVRGIMTMMMLGTAGSDKAHSRCVPKSSILRISIPLQPILGPKQSRLALPARDVMILTKYGGLAVDYLPILLTFHAHAHRLG